MNTDILKLKSFYKLVKEQKQLSFRKYNDLMNCKSLPKYILNHVHYYFKNYKIGGEEKNICCKLWPLNDNLEKKCYDCDKQNSSIPSLGSGAFGTVFSTGDDSVIKYFNINEDLFILDLEKKLPIVFTLLDTNGEGGIYKKLIRINNNQLAYEMKKLISIPINRLPWQNELLLKVLLQITFKNISKIHKIGIIHCDMKFDNIMFIEDEILNYKESLNNLLNTLKKNLKIIDYDGCILINSRDLVNIKSEVVKGYSYHPTTPAFAHPFLLEKLYDLQTEDSGLSRLQYIEGFRSAIGSNFYGLLDHLKYQKMIFSVLENNSIDESYDKIFPANMESEKMVSSLKFCDYYNLAMSFLIKKKLFNKEKNIDSTECEKVTCDLLSVVAKNINLIDNVDQKKGGRSYKNKKIVFGGQTETNVIFDVPPEINLNTLKENEYYTFEFGGKVTKHKIDKVIVNHSYYANQEELENIEKDLSEEMSGYS